jgi:hypothetical protein
VNGRIIEIQKELQGWTDGWKTDAEGRRKGVGGEEEKTGRKKCKAG